MVSDLMFEVGVWLYLWGFGDNKTWTFGWLGIKLVEFNICEGGFGWFWLRLEIIKFGFFNFEMILVGWDKK